MPLKGGKPLGPSSGNTSLNSCNTEETNDLLHMPVVPITRAKAKKFQEALNGLMKEFIWANPTLQEEFGPSQAFGGIRAHKEVQKIINILKAINGDHTNWVIKGTKEARKFVLHQLCSIGGLFFEEFNFLVKA